MRKISKNNITPRQLNLVCKHVQEQIDFEITKNFAMRPLILMADVYAKLKKIGNASPDRADQFELWSKEAVKLWEQKLKEHPKPPFGKYLRNEHGFTKTMFAEKVLTKYTKDGPLDEEMLAGLVEKYWRVAVITLDEDKKLDRTNKDGKSAENRWKDAGIEFHEGKSPHCREFKPNT